MTPLRGPAGSDANLAVIEAVGQALEGTGKPFVTPVGTLALWAGGITGRPGTEDDIVDSGPLADSENATLTRQRLAGLTMWPHRPAPTSGLPRTGPGA